MISRIAGYRLSSAAALAVATVVLAACGSSSSLASSAPASSSRESSSLPTKDNYLVSIACPSPTDCIAVGHVAPGISRVGPDDRTLIEENSGSGWRVVPSPNAPAPEVGSSLAGITCISIRNCIAVGESQSYASNPTTLVEQNTGSGWVIVPSPNADAFGGAGRLNSVACAGPAHCVAVGSNETEGGNSQTLIEENAGAGWQVVPSADGSTRADDHLSAVSCVSKSQCIAVGSSHSGDHDLPLVEENTGAGWMLVSVPGVGGLTGIACPTAATCFASGGDFAFTGSKVIDNPLVEELTNGSWQTATVPSAAGLLGGLACPTATYCMSISSIPTGSVLSTSNAVVAVESVNSTWQLASTQGVASLVDSMSGVACPDVDICVAVGDQFLGGTDPLPYPKPRGTLIAQHSGGVWTIQNSPNA